MKKKQERMKIRQKKNEIKREKMKICEKNKGKRKKLLTNSFSFVDC